MKTFKDFTETEQDEFSELFYEMIPDLDDTNTPCPWGCPWCFNLYDAKGDNIKEMVNNYYEEVKDEIQVLLKQAITRR